MRRSASFVAHLVALIITLNLIVVAVSTSPPAAPRETTPAATSLPHRIKLVAAEQDPCWDYDALVAGRGDPVRQDWYNHLRTDGGEPDYVRYYMACKPGVRYDTRQYECARGLLSGEHGGQAWDTNHPPPDDGINGPQAKPKSKTAAAGPDWPWNARTQFVWMLRDYMPATYHANFFTTPRPCRAGY